MLLMSLAQKVGIILLVFELFIHISNFIRAFIFIVTDP